MTLGVIMLVHDDFDRAEQMVRHWVAGGCPVVVHVDQKVKTTRYDQFAHALADLDQVRFCARHKCEWGTWGLVAASQQAASLMLDEFADVSHIYLASGACLPLRPIADLRHYLQTHPDCDFIESATTSDVPWTVGGLDRERFTLRFPFAWKRQRRLFDLWVRAQRALGLRRVVPDDIVPHMGSQWWCLTRQTLEGILNDPRRVRLERYFRHVWIPDESYYQTLARLHARRIESRSLTLSRFDYRGKPHIFFDDHAELLRRSRSFVARKIWRDADVLYTQFPRRAGRDGVPDITTAPPNPGPVAQVFSEAVARRTEGRNGLYMQSRYPSADRRAKITAAPYALLQGFDDIFVDFPNWLTAQTGAQVHGHLFAKDKAHFAGDARVYRGGLSDNARLRDYNAAMFLCNLIWNDRDRYHCFQFGPDDTQGISSVIASDAHARTWVISGAWAIPLLLSGRSAGEVRSTAARLQTTEDRFLRLLRAPQTRARVQIMTLAQFIENPQGLLQAMIDKIAGHRGNALRDLPQMHDLTGLPAFLQDLKNQGMHPFLTGELTDLGASARRAPKPYIITRT